MALDIEIPTLDYSDMYYPDILKLLIQYRRRNVPEITDENEYEPYVQLERAYALVGHLNNVLLDVVANESLLPTAKLLESVRNHLKLIGYIMSSASPASSNVIYELSKIFTSTTDFVPQTSQVRTEETEDRPAIIFEAMSSYTIDRTDQLSYVYGWNTAQVTVTNNTFDIGDTLTINTAQFGYISHWAVGASITDTVNNICNAINTSTNDNIFGLIKAIPNGESFSLINMDDSTVINVSETDNATDNFTIVDGTFTPNYNGEANTDSLPFTPITSPKVGDMIYFGHKHIEFDKAVFELDTKATNLDGVWEYYDGELEDGTPISVTNLGSTLKFDISDLYPAGTDCTGGIVRVKLLETSAYEDCISTYSGGINYIETSELLGQSSPSVDEGDYVVGSYWQILPDVNDKTLDLTVDDDLDFTLPESTTEEWDIRTVNTLYSAYFLRFRITSTTGTPTAPIFDRIKIDEGSQYVKVAISQGETKEEDPLGSSDGTADQKFTLTYAPMITGSLTLEVDEGTGFTSWSLQDNFLSSGANSKDFTVDVSADDTVTVKFGDGTRGKIPALGVDNIKVTYRIGADNDGNVGSSTVTVNKAGIAFVNRIWNPRQATGWTEKEGATEEDLARVKIEGPASIRVLNRGITGPDIEYLTTNYRTENGSQLVTRSKAIEETFGVKTIENIVVGAGGTQLTVAERTEMENYFNGNKNENIDAHLVTNHEVTVVNYTRKTIDVTCTVYGGNKTEIENALRQFIHPEAKYDDGVTYRWDFSTTNTTEYLRVALLYAIIYEVDPLNISNVVITSPATDVAFDMRELPYFGTLNVTIA